MDHDSNDEEQYDQRYSHDHLAFAQSIHRSSDHDASHNHGPWSIVLSDRTCQQWDHVRYGCTLVAIAYGIGDTVLSGDTHVVVLVVLAYVPAHAYYNSHDPVHIAHDNFDASIHVYVYHHTAFLSIHGC